MAITLDGQALSGLYALEILVVADDDARVADTAPGCASCDGSHCYIRESDWHLFSNAAAKAGARFTATVS